MKPWVSNDLMSTAVLLCAVMIYFVGVGLEATLHSMPLVFGLRRLALKVSPPGLNRFLRQFGLIERLEFIDFTDGDSSQGH